MQVFDSSKSNPPPLSEPANRGLQPNSPACYHAIVLLIHYLSTICGMPPGSLADADLGADSQLFVTQPLIVRDVLPNGLRLLTEPMPHVRSVSIGVWLARGSRHEAEEQSGIAHFVEHMLFKGTATRSAEDIAQAIDSIGGQMDAFTAKEYASYYIKVLDEHLPLAVDVLADIVLRPAFTPDDIEREKKVVLEEIKMVEDTPDDLVHELFTEHFWRGHPLGRPILGTRETVEALTSGRLRTYFEDAYTASNVIIAAVGNVEHAAVRGLVSRDFGGLPRGD